MKLGDEMERFEEMSTKKLFNVLNNQDSTVLTLKLGFALVSKGKKVIQTDSTR